MQTETSLSPEQEKQILAESKRWLSFYKQSLAALQAGKKKRSEQLLNEGIKIVRKMKQTQLQLAPDNEELADITDGFVLAALKTLGTSYWDEGDATGSERYLPALLEATAMLEAAPEPDFYALFDVYEVQCETYVKLKDQVKYEDVCRRALALKEKQVGQWHPEIVGFLMDLAWALEEQGKWPEAIAIKKDAFGICQNDKGPNHVEVIALKHGLACTTFLSEGMTQMEAIQKALDMLTPEERKKFTGEVAAELRNMR